MKWFILQNEEILGPFDQQHISDELGDDILVWGPGMEEWSQKSAWRQFLSSPQPKAANVETVEMEAVTTPEPESKAVVTEEVVAQIFQPEVVSEEPQEEQIDESETFSEEVEITAEKSVYEVAELALNQLNDEWFYAYKGKRFGPLNQNHLVLKLNTLDLNKSLFLWKKGMDNWEPLNNFPKVLARLEDQQTKKAA